MMDPFGAEREKKREEGFKRLLEPFPPHQIGKLPRPIRRNSEKGKCLSKRDGGNAPDWQDHFCGGYHGLPAVHLDYVGHADVTIRLCEVDPTWVWEPLGFDEYGMPLFERDQDGFPLRLWIKLTILGVTRLGVGSVEKGKFDPEKQLIGDALRNAAMRFGVAVHLWSKAEHHDEDTAADYTPRATAADDVDQRPYWEKLGFESDEDSRSSHDEIKATVGSFASDHPVRVAARVWKEQHGWPMPKQALDELTEEIARVVNSGMDDDAVAAADRDPDPSVPWPGEVTDRFGSILSESEVVVDENGMRVCAACRSNPCDCGPEPAEADDTPSGTAD